MLKKGFIALFIVILIGIGIYSIIHLFPSDTNESAEHTAISQDENKNAARNEDTSENENAGNDEANNNDHDENGAEDPFSKRVSDAVSDVFQRTIDFFANKETNVVAIGDSLTEGVGDESGGGGYVGVIEDIVNKRDQTATFDNYGKRGNRSDQMLERMNDPEIDQSLKDADIILITIGANDIMKVAKKNITDLQLDAFEKERVDYETRLKDILDGMVDRNAEADIYLLGFYNPFKRFFDISELDTIVDEWNETGADLATDYDQIEFIPTKDLFDDAEEEDNLLSDDNFHPNLDGYEEMAGRVLEEVTK